MDATNGAEYDERMRCATLLVSLLLGLAASRAEAQSASHLGDPSLPRLELEASGSEEAPPAPRSLGAFYGSAWAGWSLGLGIGAVLGAAAGGIAVATCDGDPDPSCETVRFSLSMGAGINAGMVTGAGLGVWMAAERTRSGGLPWVALLGSLLGSVVGTTLGAAVGTTMTGDFAPALSTLFGLQIGSAVLTQLFAALTYELSRL